MERFCAYRERCHQEVVSKLKDMRMIPEAIDSVVVHLIASGFLNEERFSREFVRGKFRQKGWGKNRIRQELKARDISEYLIGKALEELDPEAYAELFGVLARKRWEHLGSEQDPQKKKRKFFDYLVYRGWETGLILDMLTELEGREGN